MYVICVFVCELGAGCKITPWVQSKSMQSKQEMATIVGVGTGGGGSDTDKELHCHRRGEKLSIWDSKLKLGSSVNLVTCLFVHLKVCLYGRVLQHLTVASAQATSEMYGRKKGMCHAFPRLPYFPVFSW